MSDRIFAVSCLVRILILRSTLLLDGSVLWFKEPGDTSVYTILRTIDFAIFVGGVGALLRWDRVILWPKELPYIISGLQRPNGEPTGTSSGCLCVLRLLSLRL